MADLVRDARREFWRPPPQAEAAVNSALPDACRRCGTEFMVGAAFCHICGMGRHRSSANSVSNWSRLTSHLEFLKSLEFTSVRKWFDLPVASLCSFLVGGAFLIVDDPNPTGLTVVRDGTNVVIKWSTSCRGYHLQENGGLNPAGWSQSAAPVQQNQTAWTATIPIGNGNRFYRLRN